MITNKDEEEVLVIKTEILFPDGTWEGFREFNQKEIFNLINKNAKYLKRKFAETDPDWQQIIPQISLIVGKNIFIYRFPDTSNEKRLVDMWPIFLGGHVNEIDGGLEKAAMREFNEEISYKGNIIKKTFLGLVRKNSPLVNLVHTGLVWVFEGDSLEFEPTNDNGISDGKFISFDDAPNYMDKMTYWSKIAAPYIVKKYN